MSRIQLRPALRAYAHAPAGVEDALVYSNTKSCDWDGIDEYAESAGNVPTLSNGVTINCWVKGSIQSSNFCTILSMQFGDDGSGGWDFNQSNIVICSGGSTDRTRLRVFRNKSDGSGLYRTVMSGIVFPSTGTDWHMITVTDSSTLLAAGTLELFVDGVSQGTQVPHSAFSTGTKGIRMGKLDDLNHYDGLTDEVTIWEGVLSDGGGSQIEALHGGGEPADPRTLTGAPTLWAWYRMGDDAGDVPGSTGTLIDQQGNADLTTYNMDSGDIGTDVPT